MPVKRHICDIVRPNTALTQRGQRPVQDPAADTVVASNVLYSREPLRGRELELARQIDAQMNERVRLYVDPSWDLTSDDYLRDLTTDEVLNIGDIVYDEGIQVEAIMTVGRAA